MDKKKETPAGEVATDAEIETAIRALSDVDHFRLRKVASFWARGIAGMGLGIGADDLLQEAMKRTVAGERHWKKKVTLVKHLVETMRSITNHARDELKGAVVVPATTEDAAGRLDGVGLFSQISDGERIAAANEQLAQVAEKFATDDEVGLVLEGLAQAMPGPEIQQDLNISPTEYETIVTRLRRGVDRKEGWRP